MLEVRRNEMALRKLSGGTAQLRTLDGVFIACCCCLVQKGSADSNLACAFFGTIDFLTLSEP